jgi:hypothetical protein
VANSIEPPPIAANRDAAARHRWAHALGKRKLTARFANGCVD